MRPPTGRIATAILVLVQLLPWSSLSAQAFTDAQLLANGQEAWEHNRCVQAAEYLFAYSQRNAATLETDARLRGAVQTVISWCEAHAVIAAGIKGDCPTCPPEQPHPAVDLTPSAAGAGADPVRKRAALYATLAVAQNQANVANGCGFTGGRWDSRYDYHYNWCLSVSSDACRSETQVRQAMLDQCAP